MADDDRADGRSPFDDFLSDDERIEKALGIFSKKKEETEEKPEGPSETGETGAGSFGEKPKKPSMFETMGGKAKEAAGGLGEKARGASRKVKDKLFREDENEDAFGGINDEESYDPEQESEADSGKPSREDELKNENEKRRKWAEDNPADSDTIYESRTPPNKTPEKPRVGPLTDEQSKRYDDQQKRLAELQGDPSKLEKPYDPDPLGPDRELGILQNEDGSFYVEEDERENPQEVGVDDEADNPDARPEDAAPDQEPADGEAPEEEEQEGDDDIPPEEQAAKQAGEADRQDALSSQVNQRHAKKFLRAAAENTIEGWGDIASKGWDMAQNLVKMTLTDPGAISSSSRFIANAITGLETVSDVTEKAAKRYGIDVNADPALIKDTLRYRLYKQESTDAGQTVGNTFRAISESLARNGGDITKMTSQQLGQHVHDLREEAQRLRSRAAQPGLNSNQRAALAAQAQHLEQYTRTVTKQASDEYHKETMRTREEKFMHMEARKRAYDELSNGTPNPLSNLLHTASPTFNIDIDPTSGFPQTVQGVNTLLKTADMELGRLSMLPPDQPGVSDRIALVQKQQKLLRDWRDRITTGGNYNTVLGATGGNQVLAAFARLNPYLAYGNGSVARDIMGYGYWPQGSVTKNLQDRLNAMMHYSNDPAQIAIGHLYDNSIKASNMYQQTERYITSVSRNAGTRDRQTKRHQARFEMLRNMHDSLDKIDATGMSDAEKADIEDMKKTIQYQMQLEEKARMLVSNSANDSYCDTVARQCLDGLHGQHKRYMARPDGGASFYPTEAMYASTKDNFEKGMRWLQFVYGNADFYAQNDAILNQKVAQYTGGGAGTGGAGGGPGGGAGAANPGPNPTGGVPGGGVPGGAGGNHGQYTYDYSKWGSDDHASAIASSLGMTDVAGVKSAIKRLAPAWNLIFQSSKGGISASRLSKGQRKVLEKALGYAEQHKDDIVVALLKKRLGTVRDSGPLPDPVDDGEDQKDDAAEQPAEEQPAEEQPTEEDEKARRGAALQSLADKGLMRLDQYGDPDSVLLVEGADKNHPTAGDMIDAYWNKKNWVTKIDAVLADPEGMGLSEDEIKYLKEYKDTLEWFINEDENHLEKWEKENRGEEEEPAEDKQHERQAPEYEEYDPEGYVKGIIENSDSNLSSHWMRLFYLFPRLPSMARELFGDDYSEEALRSYAEMYWQIATQRSDFLKKDGSIDPDKVRAEAGFRSIAGHGNAAALRILGEEDPGYVPPLADSDEKPNVLGENWNSSTGDFFPVSMVKFDNEDLNKLTHKSRGYQSFNKGLRKFMEDMGGTWAKDTTMSDIQPYGIAYMHLNKALGTDNKTHELRIPKGGSKLNKLRNLLDDGSIDKAAMEHIKAFVKNNSILPEVAISPNDSYEKLRDEALKDVPRDARGKMRSLLDKFHGGEYKDLLPEGAIETKAGIQAVIKLKGMFRGDKSPWDATDETKYRYMDTLESIKGDTESSPELLQLAEAIKAKMDSKQNRPPISDFLDKLENDRESAISDLKEFLVINQEGEAPEQYGFDPDDRGLRQFLNRFDYPGKNQKGVKSDILNILNRPFREYENEQKKKAKAKRDELLSQFDVHSPLRTLNEKRAAVDSVSLGTIDRTHELCEEFIQNLGEIKDDGQEYRRDDIQNASLKDLIGQMKKYVITDNLVPEGKIYGFPEIDDKDKMKYYPKDTFTDYIRDEIKTYEWKLRDKWDKLKRYKPPKESKGEGILPDYKFTHDGTEYTFKSFAQAAKNVADSENSLEDKKATLAGMYSTLIKQPAKNGHSSAINSVVNAYMKVSGLKDFKTAKKELSGQMISGPDASGESPNTSPGGNNAKRSTKTWSYNGEKWSWKIVEDMLKEMDKKSKEESKEESKEDRMKLLEDMYCAIAAHIKNAKNPDLDSNKDLVDLLVNKYSNTSGIELPTDAQLALRTIYEGRRSQANRNRSRKKKDEGKPGKPAYSIDSKTLDGILKKDIDPSEKQGALRNLLNDIENGTCSCSPDVKKRIEAALQTETPSSDADDETSLPGRTHLADDILDQLKPLRDFSDADLEKWIGQLKAMQDDERYEYSEALGARMYDAQEKAEEELQNRKDRHFKWKHEGEECSYDSIMAEVNSIREAPPETENELFEKLGNLYDAYDDESLSPELADSLERAIVSAYADLGLYNSENMSDEEKLKRARIDLQDYRDFKEEKRSDLNLQTGSNINPQSHPLWDEWTKGYKHYSAYEKFIQNADNFETLANEFEAMDAKARRAGSAGRFAEKKLIELCENTVSYCSGIKDPTMNQIKQLNAAQKILDKIAGTGRKSYEDPYSVDLASSGLKDTPDGKKLLGVMKTGMKRFAGADQRALRAISYALVKADGINAKWSHDFTGKDNYYGRGEKQFDTDITLSIPAEYKTDADYGSAFHEMGHMADLMHDDDPNVIESRDAIRRFVEASVLNVRPDVPKEVYDFIRHRKDITAEKNAQIAEFMKTAAPDGGDIIQYKSRFLNEEYPGLKDMCQATLDGEDCFDTSLKGKKADDLSIRELRDTLKRTDIYDLGHNASIEVRGFIMTLDEFLDETDKLAEPFDRMYEEYTDMASVCDIYDALWGGDLKDGVGDAAYGHGSAYYAKTPGGNEKEVIANMFRLYITSPDTVKKLRVWLPQLTTLFDRYLTDLMEDGVYARKMRLGEPHYG